MRALVTGCCLLLLCLTQCKRDEQFSEKRVGVLVPVEHQAMQDILSGLRTGLADLAIVEAQVAHGDATLQRSMIDYFKHQNLDAIVTIGTDATLMAMKEVKDRPLIGLDVTSAVTQSQGNVTGQLESLIDPNYRLIREMYPSLRKLTMVYSSSERAYGILKLMERLASQDGIEVQPLMIQTLADLYTLSQAVAKDSELLFISKDHLAASGAGLLTQIAEQRGIPFFTCDEGSVISGASFALGNKEYDIGLNGAEITKRILTGGTPVGIPLAPLETFTIFVNPRLDPATKQLVSDAAVHLGYTIEVVD